MISSTRRNSSRFRKPPWRPHRPLGRSIVNRSTGPLPSSPGTVAPSSTAGCHWRRFWAASVRRRPLNWPNAEPVFEKRTGERSPSPVAPGVELSTLSPARLSHLARTFPCRDVSRALLIRHPNVFHVVEDAERDERDPGHNGKPDDGPSKRWRL